MKRPLALALAVGLALTACGGSDDDSASGGPTTVRLITHDSFAVSDEVLADFTAQTGIRVEKVQGGDAGVLVNQAILTKGNPQADVLFGIDSTLLTRALEQDVFVPHRAAGVEQVDAALQLDPEQHRVTPIDYGDVCLNYDKAYFAKRGLAVPTTLDQLVQPAYRGLTVVEDPATSSPGLAFLMASIATYGPQGWQGWWRSLRANGVEVVDSWETAYNEEFSGGGESKGDKPIVVSYASSPPAEVVYADPPITEAPTGVVEASCFRQVEGAGVLKGTKDAEAAGRLVDFMLSQRFQADVPLSMFVFPVVASTPLPDAFVKHAARPAKPLTLPSAQIAAERESWIGTWTDLVRR